MGSLLKMSKTAEEELDELVSIINEMMVCAELGVFNRGDDVRKAINLLMCQAADIALDFVKMKKI